MKKNLFYLVFLIVSFLHCLSGDAMLNQPASVRIKSIVNSLKNNPTLSELQREQLLLLSLHSALSSEQKAILTSVLNDAYDKRSIKNYGTALDEIALFFEQWEQMQLQHELPRAGDKRIVYDLCGDDNRGDDNRGDDNRGDDDESDRKEKKKRKIELSESSEEDLQAIEIANEEALKCVICAFRYSKIDALSKSISCCASYHLFCTDCVSNWKKKKNTCPQASCKNKISGKDDCYTNDPSEENYLVLRTFLQSCTHADAAKEQVLNLLLVRKEGISVSLHLPDSDNDSENSEDFCPLCKSEVPDDEIFITSCKCEKTYHKVCLDILRETKERCEDCDKEI